MTAAEKLGAGGYGFDSHHWDNHYNRRLIMLRFKKIKLAKDDKIHLEYDVERDTGKNDEYSVTCTDAPEQAFYLAMDALAVHVIEMCELNEDDLGLITVKGVSFSHKDGVMGAVITAQKTLLKSATPLNLNTPHKPSEPYNEGQLPGDADLLSTECQDALKRLCIQAQRYIDGHRAQMSLLQDAA
jgi:hypothetical protein